MTNRSQEQQGQSNSNSNSNPLLEGEEILFYRVLNKGFWRKKIAEIIVVSNRRVMLELPLQGKLYTLLLENIDSVEVLNQRRDSAGTMQGVGVRMSNLRTMQYQGQSRSKMIGSILLMSKNHQDFSLNGIQDPVGLSRVIKTAIKMRNEELRDQELR